MSAICRTKFTFDEIHELQAPKKTSFMIEDILRSTHERYDRPQTPDSVSSNGNGK